MQKFAPQLLAGRSAHHRRVGGRGHAQLALEQIAYVLSSFVNDGGKNVARGLVRELDDVLAKVCFDDLDAVCLEGFVETDLFGQHRLGLDHAADPVVAGDVAHDVVGLGRVASPMDLASIGDQVRLEFLQHVGEMCDGELSNRAHLVAEGRVVNSGHSEIASLRQPGSCSVESGSQMIIGERLRDATLKRRVDIKHEVPCLVVLRSCVTLSRCAPRDIDDPHAEERRSTASCNSHRLRRPDPLHMPTGCAPCGDPWPC